MLFEQKICYNSSCIGDICHILVPKLGFFEVCQFQIDSRPTTVAVVTNSWLLTSNSLKANLACIGDSARFLYQSLGCRGHAMWWYHSNRTAADPVAMVTKFSHVGGCKTAEGDQPAGLCHAFQLLLLLLLLSLLLLVMAVLVVLIYRFPKKVTLQCFVITIRLS